MSREERLFDDSCLVQPRLTRQQRREMAEHVRVSVTQDARDILPDVFAKIKAQEGLPPFAAHKRVKLNSI